MVDVQTWWVPEQIDAQSYTFERLQQKTRRSRFNHVVLPIITGAQGVFPQSCLMHDGNYHFHCGDWLPPVPSYFTFMRHTANTILFCQELYRKNNVMIVACCFTNCTMLFDGRFSACSSCTTHNFTSARHLSFTVPQSWHKNTHVVLVCVRVS